MAKHGIIGEYDNTGEDWLAYTEMMQQYFAANNKVASHPKSYYFYSSAMQINRRLMAYH